MQYEILFWYAVSIIGVLTLIILTRNGEHCSLNSNYKGNKGKFEIELKVEKVERVYTKDEMVSCGKYTLSVFYLCSKNKVKNSTIIMYDEMDKYHVGDIITLTKKESETKKLLCD